MIAMLIMGLFYLIWASFFLIHTGRCIVSGSVISWRFNRKNPYLNASTAYINSHIGSACLSSLLTSLFGLFKFEVDDADVFNEIFSVDKLMKIKIDVQIA